MWRIGIEAVSTRRDIVADRTTVPSMQWWTFQVHQGVKDPRASQDYQRDAGTLCCNNNLVIIYAVDRMDVDVST